MIKKRRYVVIYEDFPSYDIKSLKACQYYPDLLIPEEITLIKSKDKAALYIRHYSTIINKKYFLFIICTEYEINSKTIPKVVDEITDFLVHKRLVVKTDVM